MGGDGMSDKRRRTGNAGGVRCVEPRNNVTPTQYMHSVTTRNHYTLAIPAPHRVR